MKPPSIKVGDKFTKTKNPNTVWVVKRLVDQTGVPPHAELTAQKYLDRMMTMSLDALNVQNLFRRIEKD